MATTWLWIALPAAWSLQDVQASLNVVLSLLCATCIFVFSRMCWLSATAKVVKNQPVPLPALLSVTSLGEVYDVICLLGWTLFRSNQLRILAQCLTVIAFMAGAIMTGPVVRYSTKIGQVSRTVGTPGILARRHYSAISYASVLWNETEARLNAAGFPQDQLLDFLPNNTIPWHYVPAEWNSSWTMDCQKTERTSLSLSVTNTNCLRNAFPAGQVPGLLPVFDSRNFQDNFSTWGDNWESRSQGNWNVDALWFIAGWNWSPRNADQISQSVKFTIISLHLQNFRTANSSNVTEVFCEFGRGPIGAASYVKSVCNINRNPIPASDPAENFTAMPDFTDSYFQLQAYTSYYQARFFSEGITGQNITELTPDDLIRFYQVYDISKDTQDQMLVSRNMTVAVNVVDVSIILIIVGGSLALLCMIGLVRFSHFWVRHYDTAGQTPLSRLDWMLHAVEQTRPTDPFARSNRYSVTSFRQDSGSSYPGSKDDSKKAGFASATYGSSAHLPMESEPYRNSWVMSPPATATMTSPQIGYELVNSPPTFSPEATARQPPSQTHSGYFDRSNWDARSADTVSLLSQHPTAPADSLSHNDWHGR